MPPIPPAAAGLGAGALGLAGVASNLAGIVGAIPLLGPQSGLQVTPVVFQSVEQEGRWKPLSLVNQDSSDGRNFELNRQARVASLSTFGAPELKPELWGPLAEHTQTLFGVSCPSVARGPSSFSVDVTWWYDGLEIWGGYAGLAKAEGFRDVIDDMAAAALYAVPYGNYYPTRMLIAWSGWVNPVGTNFWEFKGGIVLGADGSIGPSPSPPGGATVTTATVPAPAGSTPSGQPELTDLPAYMKYWPRDGSDPKDLQWSGATGFGSLMA